MPTTFSRSLRSLEADSFRRSLWGLLLVLLFLATGCGWFFFAKVSVYETSDRARLEVERAAHPVAASVAGRIVATHLTLGQKIQAGDVLVELESENERLQLEEEKAGLATLRRRREALRLQLGAEDQAWPDEKQSALVAIDEARARQREADAAAKFAEGEAERVRVLDKDGLIAKSELLRTETESQKQKESAAAQALTVMRLESEAKSKEKNREIRLAQLQRDMALLDGDITTSEAAIKRSEFVLDQRQIRAPIAGEVGEMAELRPGGFLSEGQKIGAIVPSGELKIVAQFEPLTASGRIHPGQPARMRLAGFPWAQYGSLAGIVTGIANEPRDGQLRVELSVRRGSVPRIPLQHGLSGTIEVEVDRLSPATLVLRAAGKLLSTPHTDPGTRTARDSATVGADLLLKQS